MFGIRERCSEDVTDVEHIITSVKSAEEQWYGRAGDVIPPRAEGRGCRTDTAAPSDLRDSISEERRQGGAQRAGSILSHGGEARRAGNEARRGVLPLSSMLWGTFTFSV